ncbi:Uncharacterised protein [Klebsiella quasipneumoniae]|uniref:Uncharacterized protein n=1 Tax=Klebsiella quasipneumoniae TaxID=1463165 RepID=A0ABD7N0X5_9ENTR|nr:Uncharacterised protein [Klebsiella quasipneumoniae]SSG49273.1 Uncharacterised protein [Klebsiella quasipneumoniae]
MSYALIYLRYSRTHRRCDMSQQSTATPDPRYFQKLLPRSIRYDPISGVYYLIAKTNQQEKV